jgi:hypothetical protein
MPATADLIYLTGMAGYLLAASLATWAIWRLTRRISVPPAMRFLIRTTVLALLFSPTFFACGAAVPMPFPILVARELLGPNDGCSPHHYLVYWNAGYIVAPAWIVVAVVLGVVSVVRRRASSNYRLERP